MTSPDASPAQRPAGTNRLPGAAPDRQSSAVAVLGALLDRSLEQIAEASSDARRFDRQTIRTVSDVWDNNIFPLFGAVAGGTRSGRERRARAVLEWMADFGGTRRAWMRDQASAAGHSLDELVAAAKPDLPGRDYQGRVMARTAAVTPQLVESLAADYDLASAEVRHLQVEWSGSRLVGQLELAVGRSFPVDDTATSETATLNIRLRDIAEVRFDSDDVRGAVLRTEADGVSIGVGAGGTLRAATADLWPDDNSWHLSAAGRRADATTPARDSRPTSPGHPKAERLGADATAAATLLHRAMLEIRSVRYAGSAPRVPVRQLQRAFAGAGEAILAAGAHRTSRRREADFRLLVETWARRGGPALADWFAAVLSQAAQRPDLVAGLRDRAAPPAATGTPKQPTPAPSTPSGLPSAELRLAMYSGAHTRYGTHRDASALLLLAVPPRPGSTEDAPWRLRAVEESGPVRLRLRTEAFQGADRPRVGVDDGAGRRFVLHDGALDLTSGEGPSGDPS